MAQMGGNGNPFRPGAGRMPPLLAGRDAEIVLAEGRLRELAGGTPPSRGILFYGPRGNGKTVLVGRIAERGRKLGLRVEDLPAEVLSDHDRLVAELQERAGLVGARLTGVQVGPIGATSQPAAPTRNVSRLFAAWVQAEPSPLVVLLDEVHTIAPEVGRAFFGATHLAGRNSLPFLLVAAGTPDAPRRLREAATFTERDLERAPIGRLEARATMAALGTPAAAAGRPMHSEALSLLARESHDYPYFIQLLGSGAWDASAALRTGVVTKEAAWEGIRRARPYIERFYGERFHEARSHGAHRALFPLASLLADRGGALTDSELETHLERAAMERAFSGTWVELLQTLQDMGILWETSTGRWEMGIPSFAQHVLEREGAAREAP